MAAVATALAVTVAACGSSGSARVAPSSPPPGGYATWPQAENSAAHTSLAATKGPQTAHLRWQAHLGGGVSQGPAIGHDGTIYEANDAGVLHAIDPTTGKDRWTYDGKGKIGGDLSTTAAVLPDRTIAWPGSRNTLFGLTPDGSLRWTVALKGVPLSPAIAGDGTLYVMTENGNLSAITVTGSAAKIRWTVALGKSSFGSPAIRSDGAVLTTVDDDLVAVHDGGGKGTVRWRFAAGKAVEVSPAVTPSGITVLGTDDGFEYGVSPVGKQVWKHPVMGFSYSSPAVVSNVSAWFGDNGGVLTHINPTTGSVLGSTNATPGVKRPGNIWTAPLVDAAGDTYYGTNDGHIYGYGPAGKQLFDLPTGKTVASYPALTADGGLLIGSDDGSLYDIGS